MLEDLAVDVSVLLPVYNGMPYLSIAVDSVLQQSFPHFELIALDDGSTDSSSEYLQSLTDPRVRYVRLERVRLVEVLNHGLRIARGELIARMDADDVSLPQRFERQVELFRQDPELVLCGAQVEFIDSAGKRMVRESAASGKLNDSAIRWYQLFSGAFNHPATMFRKECAKQIGGYRKTFDVAEDYDFWTRLAVLGKCANHPELLLQYRQHAGSVTAQNQTRQLEQCSRIAARYASQVLPDVSEETWFQMRQLLSGASGQESVEDITAVRRAVRQALSLGREMAEQCDEVAGWVEYWKARLRWRTQAAMQKALPNAYRAWLWLQIARDCGFGVESLSRRRQRQSPIY